jgi:hypothetical protein
MKISAYLFFWSKKFLDLLISARAGAVIAATTFTALGTELAFLPLQAVITSGA